MPLPLLKENLFQKNKFYKCEGINAITGDPKSIIFSDRTWPTNKHVLSFEFLDYLSTKKHIFEVILYNQWTYISNKGLTLETIGAYRIKSKKQLLIITGTTTEGKAVVSGETIIRFRNEIGLPFDIQYYELDLEFYEINWLDLVGKGIVEGIRPSQMLVEIEEAFEFRHGPKQDWSEREITIINNLQYLLPAFNKAYQKIKNDKG